MIILFYIACVVILVYCLFIAWIALRLKLPGNNAEMDVLPSGSKVSIIIPCRNEADNILHCLNSIAKQSLSKELYEVIIVDDFSEDHTLKVVEQFKGRLPLTVLHNNIPGKKNALTLGIVSARNEIIITTDADCTMHAGWLKEMLHEFESSHLDMLCGPVNFNDAGSIFSQLQQAESAAMVGISMVLLNSGRPATCNGANLMYRKTVFSRIGGYQNHFLLATGDDDLLMHEFYSLDPAKVKYSMNRKAMVFTAPCADFRQFLQQRIRWLSKRKVYQYQWNSVLHLLVFAQLLAFYFAVFYCFVDPGLLTIGVVVMKYLSDMFYGLRLQPLFEFRFPMILIMPFFESYIFCVLLFSGRKKNQWKGRSV